MIGLSKLLGQLGTPSTPPLLTDQQHGSITAWCLTRDYDWINRRVERIELVDDTTVRRQMSVDFTLPAWLAEPGVSVYVPLAVLRKRPLTNFDVWDEEGRPLGVLNTIRNGDISAEALKTLARRQSAARNITLRSPERLDSVLSDIARRPVEDARTARRAIEADRRSFRRQWQRLMADGVLAGVVEDLTEGFQLLVPVEMQPGRTRVVKFRYDEQIEWYGNTGASRAFSLATRGLFEFAGLLPKRWDMPVQRMDKGQGYHVEVVAPNELDIREAILWEPRQGSVFKRRVALADGGGGGNERVHLNPPRLRRTNRARLNVRLRPQRRGVMLAYVATAELAAIELLLSKPHLRDIEPQTGSALLLLVPTLIAALLVRPAEHSFASRMLGGVRLLTLGAAIAALAAAGTLGIYGSGPPNESTRLASERLDHLEHLWSVWTWIALGCAGVLTANYVLSGWPLASIAHGLRQKFRKRPG